VAAILAASSRASEPTSEPKPAKKQAKKASKKAAAQAVEAAAKPAKTRARKQAEPAAEPAAGEPKLAKKKAGKKSATAVAEPAAAASEPAPTTSSKKQTSKKQTSKKQASKPAAAASEPAPKTSSKKQASKPAAAASEPAPSSKKQASKPAAAASKRGGKKAPPRVEAHAIEPLAHEDVEPLVDDEMPLDVGPADVEPIDVEPAELEPAELEPAEPDLEPDPGPARGPISPADLALIEEIAELLADYEDARARARELRRSLRSLDHPEAAARVLALFERDGDPFQLRTHLLVALERMPEQAYFAALLDAMPRLVEEAPEWAFSALMRLLNSRNHPRDSGYVFEEYARLASPRVREAVAELLLERVEELPEDQASMVVQTIAVLTGRRR
jgi:Meckel syndrome type 1 protein